MRCLGVILCCWSAATMALGLLGHPALFAYTGGALWAVLALLTVYGIIREPTRDPRPGLRAKHQALKPNQHWGS